MTGSTAQSMDWMSQTYRSATAGQSIKSCTYILTQHNTKVLIAREQA